MSLDKKVIVNTIEEVKGEPKKRGFDQSIELILNLKNLDMKSAQGRIREVVELPYLPGKPNKIFVAASGELAIKAKEAKADFVIQRSELEEMAGSKKELRKIANEYDYFMAEAPLMPVIGKILGPVLGPRGKMPMPVPPTADINILIQKHRKTVTIRTRNQPVVQCRVGTEKMKNDEITENIQTVLRTIEKKLKNGLKDVKVAYIKTSMGKPVKIKN